MSLQPESEDPRGRWRHVVQVALAVVVLTAAAVGAGALAVHRVASANAEVIALSYRNIARLNTLGEIRGQQARINDGVVSVVAPNTTPGRRVRGRHNIRNAARSIDRLMRRYGTLVQGTASQAAFTDLRKTWKLYHSGLTVHILGEGPPAGGRLLPSVRDLGQYTVAVTNGLDGLADLERTHAAAVADRRQDTYRETVAQVSATIVVGLLISGGMAVLAVRAATARRRGEQRFRALVQASSDVITVLDAEGRQTYISPSVQSLMGHAPETLLTMHHRDLLHPDDMARAREMFVQILADDVGEHRAEMRVGYADGTWHWHELVARNLLHDPAVRGIVVNHRDITERREFQDRLAYDAAHDTLTGLANRATFLEDLDTALTHAVRHGHDAAVLFVDLNDFKQVNDTWGHEVGDGLLVAFGRLLERSVLGADTVARLGGDEFGIVLASIDSPGNAHAVARRIMTGLAEPLDAAGRPLHTRASIGIALSDANCRDADELLRRADTAMYHVKRQGISGWQLYSDELRPDPGPVVTADELRHAIPAGELFLQYQPIVALHSGEMLGVEALVRWRHPALGLLGPGEFIPLADASGLILPLGAWVLREACIQVRAWQQQGDRAMSLSVNLSPRQLDEPSLVDSVLDVLRHTGLAPRDLILEVTEQALVNDTSAIPALARLRSYGIRLALDDFGTGYSSLRYLTNLPVDILKLDRCFVAELNGTPEGSAVAEAVVRLSHALNLDTVAEGIENVEQATELTLLGYPLAQGYHFARPMDPEQITALLGQTGADRPALAPATALGSQRRA